MRIKLKTAWSLLLIGALAAPLTTRGGLVFDGTSQYVTFGPARSLGSPAFTVETWFNWTGGGVPANTGVGGLQAVPLVAKLTSEADGDQRDGNYFLGIRTPNGVLGADLEEGATGAQPGLNHPVSGVTVITPNAWHHAAVTYDSTNWMLFLDGHLEATLNVGQPPRWDSIQHAALGSSLNSTGAPQGYFAGQLDEVRIWSYALSASQIASNRYVQIRSAPRLLARWSLAETAGLIVHDNSGHGVEGTLVNGPRWVANQRAVADVVTAIKLTPINPERTAALRRAEAQRMPPIFRHDPTIAGKVEKTFRADFVQAREKFLAALAATFPQGKLPSSPATDASFAQFVTTFGSMHNGFPPDISLAQTWARGQPDTQVLADLTAKLQQGMARYICPDLLPKDATTGTANVRIYTRNFGNPDPGIEAVQAQSLSCARTNLYRLKKARMDLQQAISTNQNALATYLTGLLKENCLFDGELSRRSRTLYTDTLFAADHYEPGQVLVRKGQIMDAGIKAALDELKKQTAAEEAKARAAAEHVKAEMALQDLQQRTAFSEFKSQHFGRQNRWLFAGLIVVAVMSSIAVWQLARFRRAQNLLPVPVQRGGMAGLPPDPTPEDLAAAEWRDRALTAEKQAAQTSAAVRAGLLAHLAQWLKSKLLRGLLAQRSHLLNTQENAELELAELETRLARLHAPMEQRLNCYRERIADLEHQLAVKGQENRDLIQAKIDLTRKRLEAEQERKTQESAESHERPEAAP